MGYSIFEEMKAYVCFEEQDERHLNSLVESITNNVDHIVGDFYDRVDANEDTRSLVEVHSSRNALEGTLREWVLSFLAGPHNNAYYTRRCHIGRIHFRIGLKPHFVFVAMNTLRDGITAFCNQEQLASVNKMMDIELAIINQVYWEELTQIVKQQEQLATIGEMAGHIAHELRNPLAAMQNATFYIRTKIQTEDNKALRHIDLLDERIEQCSRTIQSVLDYTKEVQLKTSVATIEELIDWAVQDLDLNPKVSVCMESPTVDSKLKCDTMLIRSVFRNIICNAAQAMENSGNIYVSLSEINSTLTVRIRDEGPGVTPEIKHKLFVPLTTSKVYGFGLGLAYCTRVMSMHSGRIYLNEDIEDGAEFVLEFPRESILE